MNFVCRAKQLYEKWYFKVREKAEKLSHYTTKALGGEEV
jgi:hypothetical protein